MTATLRIEGFLRSSAARLGARTALVAGKTRLTFAELDLASDRMAAALAAGGIAPGDRVVVFMDDSWQAVVSVFAVLKAGAVFAPADSSTKADALAWLVNDCRAAALVTQSRLAAAAAAVMAAAPSLRLTVIAGCEGAPVIDGIMRFEDAVAGEGPAPEPAGGGADPAMLIYRPGPAGLPEGVTMTHDDVVAAIAADPGNAEDGVMLSLPPLCLDGGLCRVLTATRRGAALVLEKPAAAPLVTKPDDGRTSW